MELPEVGKSLLPDEAVNAVMGPGSNEGRRSLVHDEEDNPQGKDICLQAFVIPSLHLWRAVALSSHTGSQLPVSVISLAIPGQSEV